VEDYHPPKSACCLQAAAQRLADQLQDWNQIGWYHEDNRRLKAYPPDRGESCFLAIPSVLGGI
jgi:hypothetical protein